MDSETEVISPKPTILRIKRKRNEEPLDALVVESRERRKKSRGGVFKFAQTVESDAWDDEKQAKDIQDQISRLTKESSVVSEPPLVSPALPRQKSDAPHYTILSHDDRDPDNNRVPRPTNPPKVISHKDLPSKGLKSDYNVYDAVLMTERPAHTPDDPELEKFLPMLNDYLKLNNDVVIPEPIKEIAPSSGQRNAQSIDYVYDIFYHSPTALNQWNEFGNFATLSGLPSSITGLYDSGSESEEEDEADEDSNAEEYYKNDYPEDEETSDSDEFHEDSEQDDILHYDEDGDDHEWR